MMRLGRAMGLTPRRRTAAVPPPVASFTRDPATIADGESVDFTDTSTGDPTSWSWLRKAPDVPGFVEFSTAQNPTGIVFVGEGEWTVRLIASNAGGASEPYDLEVTVSPPPTILSADINAAGTTLTINADQALTGTTGFSLTVGGVNRAIVYTGGDGTDTYTFSIANAVGAGQTVSLDYTPGNVEGDATGVPLITIVEMEVTNNSTTPAIVSGTTVADPGPVARLIELVFSDLVFLVANGDFATKANGTPTNQMGSSEITYDSGGDGTTNWVRLQLTNVIGANGDNLTVSFDAGWLTINADQVTDPYAAAVNFPITNTIPA